MPPSRERDVHRIIISVKEISILCMAFSRVRPRPRKDSCEIKQNISYKSRMTGIFKFRRPKIRTPMKHLGLVPIILLFVLGVNSAPSAAELTANQQIPSPAVVGETVEVTVMLTYNGVNSIEAVVTPSLPLGIVTDMPGGQKAELSPGIPSPISYPIRAERSGLYVIGSQIAYAEDGTWRNLRLEAPFTALEKSPRSVPGIEVPAVEMPGFAKRI